MNSLDDEIVEKLIGSFHMKPCKNLKLYTYSILKYMLFKNIAKELQKTLHFLKFKIKINEITKLSLFL